MASGGCGVAALSSLGSPRNLVLGGVLFREGWVCCGDALAACAGRGAKPRRASSGRTFDAACGGHFFLSFFLSFSLSLSLSLSLPPRLSSFDAACAGAYRFGQLFPDAEASRMARRGRRRVSASRSRNIMRGRAGPREAVLGTAFAPYVPSPLSSSHAYGNRAGRAAFSLRSFLTTAQP